MKTSELLKLLKQANCQMVRHGSSHDIWTNPKTGKKFSVPRHKAEIPTGTVSNILKDAGLR